MPVFIGPRSPQRPYLRTCIQLMAALTLSSGALVQAQRPAGAAALVFDGVTVVDVEAGRLVPDQRVVIEGHRIRAVGSGRTVAVQKGAQVVDARGKYLMPGLWDMHTHSMHLTKLFYPLFLANGVTGIRDAASPIPLDTLRRWRQEILAGVRVGPPRQLFSGPGINSDSKESCTNKKKQERWSHHVCIVSGDSAGARRVVDSLKAAGGDMLKLYDLSPGMYFTLANEARRQGIRFGGHVGIGDSTLAANDVTVTELEASDSGVSIIDHVDWLKEGWAGRSCLAVAQEADAKRCGVVAERFKHGGTWWVPTLGILTATNLADYLRRSRTVVAPYTRLGRSFLADSVYQSSPLHVKPRSDSTALPGMLDIARRAGVPMLAGTDVGSLFLELGLIPGFALHAELALYVAEGLTPREALQAATLNPARLLRGIDSLGMVAPGRLADLVLLDADPLADITNTTTIRAVVANGRYFDRAALDRLLAEARVNFKTKVKEVGLFDYRWVE